MISRVLLCLLALAPSLAAEARSLDEITACTAANLPETTSVQDISFVSTDRIGARTGSSARIYWQRFDDGLARAMIRFSEPTDLRGAGVLLIEKKDRMPDQFMYLPELGRVRRVSTRMMSSSLFGTDFSYEDFTRLQEMGPKAKQRSVGDVELEGHAVHVVESVPDPESGSSYARLVSFLDVETCLPLKVEMFEQGDTARKISTTPREKMQRAGRGWVPMEVRIQDLREGTETTLVVDAVETGGKISRKTFTQNNLQSRD